MMETPKDKVTKSKSRRNKTKVNRNRNRINNRRPKRNIKNSNHKEMMRVDIMIMVAKIKIMKIKGMMINRTFVMTKSKAIKFQTNQTRIKPNRKAIMLKIDRNCFIIYILCK